MSDVDGRRRHYGEFYGLPDAGDPDDDRPLWLVHGNCQAEALRVLLSGARDAGYRTVRVPPVHELQRSDLGQLAALAGRAAMLLSQPIRDDYRDLPVGTAQVAALLPAGAQVLRWPVVRYAGLHPYQVIVRHPTDRSADPPVVPYHDLRTIAAALADGPVGPFGAHAPAPSVYRELAASSVAELTRREVAQADVVVSDLLAAAGAEAAHTINHPGNIVLGGLAARVQAAAGVSVDVGDPGRDLLGGIRAPVDADVLDALGLTAPARRNWLVHGAEVEPQHVHQVQAACYRADPDWLVAAVARHGGRMDRLGLS